MMHLLFSVGPDRFRENSARLAAETGLWLWPSAVPTGDPDVVRTELTVGSATLRYKPDFIAGTLSELALG